MTQIQIDNASTPNRRAQWITEIVRVGLDKDDINDGDFASLFEIRQRHAYFAFAGQLEDGSYLAIRDHIGSVPLFYRVGSDGGIKFSVSLADMVVRGDRFSASGLDSFFVYRTSKLIPLIEGVNLVPPGTVLRIDRTTGLARRLYQYRFKPNHGGDRTMGAAVSSVDDLFRQAISRIVEAERCSVYLSGGPDSALIAYYLRNEAHAEVDAYTSAPWGLGGGDLKKAQENAKKLKVRSHTVVPVETADFAKYLESTKNYYPTPNGVITNLAIASLWANSDISKSAQIWSGQNADTIAAAMPQQYFAYLVSLAPNWLRRIARTGASGTLRDVYSRRLTRQSDPLIPAWIDDLIPGELTRIEQVTLLGMLLGPTPADGESMSMPVLTNGISFGDPYLDCDLIEYMMGLKLRLRVVLKNKGRSPVKFEKRVFNNLAQRLFGFDTRAPKKSFVVPLEKDAHAVNFKNGLSASFGNRSLVGNDARFAGTQLNEWIKLKELDIEAIGAVR